MHALTILHRIFSTSFPEIHTKRLASLLAAVETVVTSTACSATACCTLKRPAIRGADTTMFERHRHAADHHRLV
jgi:hypothetical protein